MEKFTQKWCIVALFEELPEGYEFDKGDWPLHMTFADVHDANWHSDPSLMDGLQNIALKFTAFSTEGLSLGNLGPEANPTLVSFMDKNESVLKLHNELIDFLEAHGATFNNPEFNKQGFVAHSTVQKHAKIEPGETVDINNLVLIDMFPHKDGTKRKIAEVLKLN